MISHIFLSILPPAAVRMELVRRIDEKRFRFQIDKGIRKLYKGLEYIIQRG
jgi:hypothetical protein